MNLPISMRSVDTPLHRARNKLAEKNITVIAAQDEHDAEKSLLRAQIYSLKAELARERAKNVETIHRLTQLLSSIPSSSSNP